MSPSGGHDGRRPAHHLIAREQPRRSSQAKQRWFSNDRGCAALPAASRLPPPPIHPPTPHPARNPCRRQHPFRRQRRPADEPHTAPGHTRRTRRTLERRGGRQVIDMGVGHQDVADGLTAHRLQNCGHMSGVVRAGIDHRHPALANDIRPGAGEGDGPSCSRSRARSRPQRFHSAIERLVIAVERQNHRHRSLLFIPSAVVQLRS